MSKQMHRRTGDRMLDPVVAITPNMRNRIKEVF